MNDAMGCVVGSGVGVGGAEVGVGIIEVGANVVEVIGVVHCKCVQAHVHDDEVSGPEGVPVRHWPRSEHLHHKSQIM